LHFHSFFSKPVQGIKDGSSSSSSSDLSKDDEEDKNSEVDKYPNGSLTIYFGSQTGTSEGFSKVIAGLFQFICLLV